VRLRSAVLLAAAALAIAALGLAAFRDGSPEPPPRAVPFMVLPPLAGVSARGVDGVEPARPGDFGADTTGPVWHLLQHRCAACHALPSPAQHPAAEWTRTVDRMSRNMDSAGLLPLLERDAAAIAEFLRTHAPGEPGKRANGM
jgi:mono/diheme cytochrome c family protein